MNLNDDITDTLNFNRFSEFSVSMNEQEFAKLKKKNPYSYEMGSTSAFENYVDNQIKFPGDNIDLD